MWLSVSSFVATVLLCSVLQLPPLKSTEGLSYFGNLHETIFVYGLGLTATSYFLLLFCQRLKSFGNQVSDTFRIGLQIVALALLGIVATPSDSSLTLIKDLHVTAGLAIFILQAGLSLNYLIRVKNTAVDWFLLGLQLLAIAVAGLSFHRVGVLELMLPAQFLAVSAFFALLIRAVNHRAAELAAKP